MCKLTLYFGAQCIQCRATLAVCEELAHLFAPDAYIIEPVNTLEN